MIILKGKVIKGDQYGKVLGFPTANIDRRSYSRRKMKIKFGIYGGWAEVNVGEGLRPSQNKGRIAKVPLRRTIKTYKAAIVIGPLDKHRLPKIEAHLLGFKGNLYGRKIILVLVKYIRPFRKFNNIKQLKVQIAKDIKIINNIKFQISNVK